MHDGADRREPGRESASARPLADLLPHIPNAAVRGLSSGARVSAITADSRQVRPGSLFVAIRGTRSDGHDFLQGALAAGAAALVVEAEPPHDPPVPMIRVQDTRRALGLLAAAWNGCPADDLTLVGITGTVGKTSVLALLESILNAAGIPAGSVGSLGLRARGRTLVETGHTAPDPLTLHGGLRRIRDAGVRVVAAEATSHALTQKRMAGLTFRVGVFTNLVPLEHSEYHRTFRDYVNAKRLFFDYLEDCAPLIYGADDRTVRRLIRDYRVEPIGCGTARTAHVRLEVASLDRTGTRLLMNARRPIPRLEGGSLQPFRLPLELRLLGRSNLSNAALAAVTALTLGAEPGHVAEVLRRASTPKRRMQVLHAGRFTLLDDTVGHPDSVSAAFEVAGRLASRRLHVAFAIRGRRGVRINHHLGTSLGIWAGKLNVRTLVVTRSEDVADERNRVAGRERDAFVEALRESGVAFREEARLEDAVAAALDPAEEGDVVLLLGAQGMDRGAELARSWLSARPAVT